MDIQSSPFAAQFEALHHADKPLLLPNAWDAASARLFEALGAPAIATSSAAVAWARGYPDGSALPQSELLSAVRGIAHVIHVPLTVDLEDGYSADPQSVATLVREIAHAGAVGINLEDGNGTPELLSAKIQAIRVALGEAPFYINARTDVYLLGLAHGPAALEMSIARLRQYQATGASGVFVPIVTQLEDMRAIAAAVPLPLNVMALPNLPSVAEMQSTGVRRISAGPAIFEKAYGLANETARAFLSGDLNAAFGASLDYGTLNRLFTL